MDLRIVSRWLALFLFAFTGLAQADTAAFDLTGPSIDIKVTRKGKTLPISQVPNLQPGDRLWIHPALPEDQSAQYLLVAVFLRGATNPPPEKWFTRAETWTKKVREEGIVLTVPPGAEQAVLFLAPKTSGDFATLRSAVRGRPGSFVRAIQDLERASLDRSRLETYLAAVHQAAEIDPATVHDRSVLLARSLNIRLDEDCFKKLVEQQASCLLQKSENLVLQDGHSQSMVGVLTSGAASDLIGQITYTATAGSGYFSPYVGAIVDLGRILDSLHTAQYQYIPALGLPKQDELQLKLNSPPSFHNPKSVIVVALPAIRSEKPPPLRAVDPQQGTCVQDTPLVMHVAGAPLAFSSDLAHDMVLHINAKSGPGIDLPAKADAVKGGYLIDTSKLAAAALSDSTSLEGYLHGMWGFDPFTGPTFKLQRAAPARWSIPQAETASLVAGREHTFHLHADAAACVNQVTLQTSQGSELKLNWKAVKPDELEVKIAAEHAVPGSLTMSVAQTGLPQPDAVKINMYIETAHLDRFVIIPGDQQATLRGSRLDEVASVNVKGVLFKPFAQEGRDPGVLPFAAEDARATSALVPDDKLNAHVALKDGRNLEVPAIVESPRPSVALISKRVELGSASTTSAIRLANQDELPLDGRISFSLKSKSPAIFPRGSKIEIATADESLHTLLTIADGSLTLQDTQTVLATFDPTKSFGNSAFGPLRFRPVDERGLKGDWQPLATLVRVPSLRELRCPEDVTQPCILSGTSLFLLHSVGADPQFANAVSVPEGFVDSTLSVPRPIEQTLYVKLRDDPTNTNTTTLAIALQ